MPVIEDCFRRMAAGEVELMPRRRFPVEGGYFAVMAAADRGLGVAGLKSYTLVEGQLQFVVCLFDLSNGALFGARRRRPARAGPDGRCERSRGEAPRATGCDEPRADRGRLAGRVAARRDPGGRADDRAGRRLEPDARAGGGVRRAHGAEVAETPADAGACDVVVTVTTSKDPVLRGDWLSEGALVCAIGANDPRARELDSQVIARASFVCCDSLEDAKLESGDLIEPVAAGQLDWLEVQELHDVVSGEVPGRQSDADIVVFKSNGIAPWDVAIGTEVVRRARERGRRRDAVSRRATRSRKTISWAPSQRNFFPSGRRFSLPSTIVAKWFPASWPAFDAKLT